MGLLTHRMSYVRARSVDEAVEILARSGESARALAGGQSLIPLMKLELSQPEVLIDLSGIQELDQIRDSGSVAIEVGAMVRHARLRRDPVVGKRLPLLSEVA